MPMLLLVMEVNSFHLTREDWRIIRNDSLMIPSYVPAIPDEDFNAFIWVTREPQSQKEYWQALGISKAFQKVLCIASDAGVEYIKLHPAAEEMIDPETEEMLPIDEGMAMEVHQ